MRCFVCHLTQLKLLDVQGKHIGLMSYNKNHGTSDVKKHDYYEHLDLLKKWGFLLL